MRDNELLCEIEILENRVCRLEMEKMDMMFANGKNKKKLKLKTDTIKKQNVKLKKLQHQLDHQKARIEELEGQFAYECECNKQFVQLQKMWNELKEWVGDNIIENNDSVDPLSTKIEQLFITGKLASFENIKNKMQELEQGEKDVED